VRKTRHMTSSSHKRGEPSKTEMEFAGLVRDLGLTFTTGRPISCGAKSDGQDRNCIPDLLFSGLRLVVFVDGCYWHRCLEHGPEDAQAVAIRDKDTAISDGLRGNGWQVIRVWEHDDLKAAAEEVADAAYGRHASHKAIHHYRRPCEHPDGWCDYCSDDPHAFVVKDGSAHCERCGLHANDHESFVASQIFSQMAALAHDMTLADRRYTEGHRVGLPEIRELAAVATRIAQQVSFLTTDQED
jgi:DNA mismatch endonuclease, patch repair protein